MAQSQVQVHVMDKLTVNRFKIEYDGELCQRNTEKISIKKHQKNENVLKAEIMP